jgi:hypothetical protein
MIITNTERKNKFTIVRMQDQETSFRSWMVLRDGFAWKCGTGSISFVIDPETDSVVGFVEWPVCEITHDQDIGPIYEQVFDIHWDTNWEESDFVQWIAEGNTILNKGCLDQERTVIIPDEDSPF